ncbi:MAG: hypothetical protein KDE31_37165, partial [Caldilineaceae bacterium]|nr:hypothetical protein [Caldilineaceae bacterium]
MKSLLQKLQQFWQPPSTPDTGLPTRPVSTARHAAFTIPVLLLHYFPLTGDRIDQRVTGDVGAPLRQIRHHTAETTQAVIDALTRGSIYHGYKDPQAQPSLRYEIVDSLEFFAPLPTWHKPNHRVPMTDYNAIMRQIDIADWVEERGIKE